MKIKSERGQSLVELAISITILIFLLAGAVEFGMAFFQFVQLRDAAQEGALYGSMNPDQVSTIETRIRGASNSPIDLAGAM
jgi:Flp pilus assembly protein TadG